ncbi:MAG: hypothetical protein MI919_11190, partial [Holophagales bacterium]|nr:hypothetical protein [Holophagales bacterium]
NDRLVLIDGFGDPIQGLGEPVQDVLARFRGRIELAADDIACELFEEAEKEVFLAVEGEVDRTFCHAGGFSDLADGRLLIAVPGEHRGCGGQEPAPSGFYIYGSWCHCAFLISD